MNSQPIHSMLSFFVTRALLCCFLSYQKAFPAEPTGNQPPAIPSAGSATVEDLSALLAASVKKHQVPGMAAAVVTGDRVTAIGAAGVRSRGGVDKITVHDCFHIGSDTKSMTATLIAMFVDEGKLRWDSTPAEVLSKQGFPIDSAWKRVTLEELLTHRAGVRANPDPLGMLVLRATGDSPQTGRRDVCRAVLRVPPEKEPGKGFQYSNTGYIIAGAMLETIAKKPWEELMRHRLFEPLGMTNAGFGPPGMPNAKSGEASTTKILQPYGHLNGQPIPPAWYADNPPLLGPAGTVHVSLHDWAIFASLHLAGERGTAVVLPAKSKPLLSVGSLKRLHTPIGGAIGKKGPRYAMGWAVKKDSESGETVLEHFGSNRMWMAAIELHPERNFALLVATNEGNLAAAKACREILKALAERFPQPPSTGKNSKPRR